MIPEVVRESVETFLSVVGGTPVTWLGEQRYGSSISESWRIETNQGYYFLKHNLSRSFPEMFEAEARGLQLLRDSGCLQIPDVLAVDSAGDHSFILMEYLKEQDAKPKMFENFGRAMAEMHQHSWKAYGLAYSNYIGSLRQTNAPRGNWIPFFIEERLEPMLRLAVERKKIDQNFAVSFEKLFHKMEELIPVEKPALLHGDLWAGNFIPREDCVALIDPAVYYGHREVDIAMTLLFGGFSQDFYDAYNEVFPLEAGWQDRIELFNLYPILVHVNLFGSQYQAKLQSYLDKYIK